jgi:hypothetical protein
VVWVGYLFGFSAGWFALLAFEHGQRGEKGLMIAAILMTAFMTGLNHILQVP